MKRYTHTACRFGLCCITAILLACFAMVSLAYAIPLTESLNDVDSISSDAQAILDMASPAQRSALEAYLLQIAEIDLETQIAVEEYNSAHNRLIAIHSDIAQKELDLEVLNKAYAIQTKHLGDRAVMFYKGGNLALVEMILDATSIQNFIQRLSYLSIVNINDVSRRERIGQEKTALQESLAQLLLDRDEAASLDFELKARKIEIENRNKQRTDVLVKENPELADLVRAYYIVDAMRESRLNTALSASLGTNVTVPENSPAETALTYRGIPYAWGGAGKDGFDSSGFLMYVFSQHEVELTHSVSAQASFGKEVMTKSALRPGDAVFFGSPARHAGIYIGNGYFVHAPNTGDVVKVSLLSERSDYAGARRYEWTPRSSNPL